MTTFPKLSEEEFEKLPQVFKEIIKWDEKDPRQNKVIPLEHANAYLDEVRDWKFNRNNLSDGARNVLQNQRGGKA